jgi:hypothetical protein
MSYMFCYKCGESVSITDKIVFIAGSPVHLSCMDRNDKKAYAKDKKPKKVGRKKR